VTRDGRRKKGKPGHRRSLRRGNNKRNEGRINGLLFAPLLKNKINAGRTAVGEFPSATRTTNSILREDFSLSWKKLPRECGKIPAICYEILIVSGPIPKGWE